jgi:PAS domain S-box-containing protein
MLMRGLPDAAWVKDCEGTYAACSPAFEELLGIAAADILGRTDRDLLGRRASRCLARAGARGLGGRQGNRLRAGNDAARRAARTARDHDHACADRWLRSEASSCVARDISARKIAREALRASEARNSSLVAALTEGVVLIGADGRIETCNPAAQRILGMPQQEMIGLVEPTQLWQPIG